METFQTDEKGAISIAVKAIEEKFPDFDFKEHECHVSFDKTTQEWIVNYRLPEKVGVITLGGGCVVKIRKSDGKVTNIYGEK